MKFGQVAYPVTFLLLVLLTGLIALSLLQTGLSLQTLMQIIALLTILIVTSTRVLFPKIRAQFGTKVAYLIEGVPVLLFIYILILSTGGVASPFLVLTHFFALAIAFLLSPQLAVEFIFATVSLLGTQIYFDTSAQKLVSENLFVVILYSIAYLALVPISYAVAKEYKFKEEWANLLEKQIATSRAQEEQLLTNIEEAIVVINPNFDIVYANQKTQNLFKISATIAGQNFYKIFNLKDKDGRDLYSYSLPFGQTLNSKILQQVSDLQISGPSKKFIRADLKMIPALTVEGPLGLILVIYDKTSQNLAQKKEESTAPAALAKFLNFLDIQRKALVKLSKNVDTAPLINELTAQNEELAHLSQDFIYTLRLESGEIGALSDLIDLGKITEEVLYMQKPKAQEFGVILTTLGLKDNLPLQPKTNLKIAVKKRVFPQAYVLGNENLLKDSLARILEIAFRISSKGSMITLLVERQQDLTKIIINCPKPIIDVSQIQLLFEKFFASLGNVAQLASASGLEGYIARNLFSQMGASVRAETQTNWSGFSFIITFGSKDYLKKTG